jgi:peptidyl-prolyl cis-trans isomerase A (cyclophilin A)
MCTLKRSFSLVIATIVAGLAVSPRSADATIVEFQTVMGNFEVNLYDNGTPATVANFLNYLNNGAYTDSIIHRSAPGFVIQGGGLMYDVVSPLAEIPSNPAVVNEPNFSNVGGTIAMAKIGGNPDSATNQFFFNLVNNSENLDGQNGGFTVFGEVVGNGMQVVNAIAALPTYNFTDVSASLDTLPLRSYVLNAPLDDTNLIIVTEIIVSDSTVDSAAGLNPPANNANSGGDGGGSVGGGGGGGSFGSFALFALLLVQGLRRLLLGATRASNT